MGKCQEKAIINFRYREKGEISGSFWLRDEFTSSTQEIMTRIKIKRFTRRLTSRHWSSSRSMVGSDGNYVPYMKHNNSFGAARADT